MVLSSMLRSYDAEMTHNDLSAERSDRGVKERLAPDRPAAADHHVSAAGGKPSRPASMFSALGHRDTIWSDVKGDLALSRQIAWDGCTAATHKIITASGDAEIRSRSLELHFSWNSGYVEADAESARQIRAYRNRPRYGFILPPDATAEAERMKARLRSHPVDHAPLVTAPSAVVDIIREAIDQAVKG